MSVRARPCVDCGNNVEDKQMPPYAGHKRGCGLVAGWRIENGALHDLGTKRLRLRKPIRVEAEAWWTVYAPEFVEYGEGPSRAKAEAVLKRRLVSLYDDLTSPTAPPLSPRLQRWKRRFEKFVEPVGETKR